MDAGEFTEYLVFQTLAEAPNAATGGLTPTYTTAFEAFAKVTAARGGRFVDDHQVDDFPTFTVTIRYRADWRAARFFNWSGRRWRIAGGSEIRPRELVSFGAIEEGPI